MLDVRKEIIRRGRTRPCMRIVRLLFAALSDPAGVTAHRLGALERVALILHDWLETHRRLADTETRMTAVLDQLQLTELVTSIPGLSTTGAAASLAETANPNRFATARALVKHAGLAPREKLSGTFVGRTKLTGQGQFCKAQVCRRCVRLLAAGLDEHWSLEGLTTLVYGVPKVMAGLSPDTKPTPELKMTQRSFFVLVYRLLIGKETGPRLPTLLLAVRADRIRP
ncbi:hypothetical protein BG844_27300 [Couchioplanes caeruleus subsp. caeruleus]|uniref:Transposase IS116/IS110/IS902 C-terminal domain-containing protein n=1 Tax=Couchioplanes caeruleus subsp. caeruleus TaxID=56427 RepID=A0A1K0FEJ8_9ACTN|nr:hypothetical protein BG844_27300 [Couchioplanes caeruleus subsp. caeruleus]